jgi:hypothetical protein
MGKIITAFRNLYSDTYTVVKSKWVKLVVLIARILEMISSCQILVGNPERKTHLGET